MKKLQDLYYRIDGNKTYIIAFITAALNLAVAFGWVSTDNLAQINMVLVALGFGAVKSAIKKV